MSSTRHMLLFPSGTTAAAFCPKACFKLVSSLLRIAWQSPAWLLIHALATIWCLLSFLKCSVSKRPGTSSSVHGNGEHAMPCWWHHLPSTFHCVTLEASNSCAQRSGMHQSYPLCDDGLCEKSVLGWSVLIWHL